MTSEVPTTTRLRPRRPRRVIGWIAAIAVLVGAGTYVPVTLLAPLDAAAASVSEYASPARDTSVLSWPEFGASAIGADGYDGVLESSGTEAPLPIASVSKIITALVVLESRPLEPQEQGPAITLTDADADLYGSYLRRNGSVVPSQAGYMFSERQMLEIVLVASANNYAESLATWAFGSVPAFADATRQWLDRHGLPSTTIVEPTGMSPANVSTSTDLVQLGKLALADPVVAAIVSSPAVTLPAVGELHNSNRLLGLDGIDGIKTGNLDGFGSNLLFSADYAVGDESVTVIGVVLGGADRDSLNTAVQSLLGSVERGFHQVTLAETGESFATFSTPWDASAEAVATDDASVLVWSDTPVTAEVSVDEVTPAMFGEPADLVGSVTFTAGPRTVTVPLGLDTPISEPDPLWRLLHPFDTGRV